jgi:hypothetical protein
MTAGSPKPQHPGEGARLRWEPAVDVTRIVLQMTFAAIAVTFLLRGRRR